MKKKKKKLTWLEHTNRKVMCMCLPPPCCAAQQHCMTYGESNVCVCMWLCSQSLRNMCRHFERLIWNWTLRIGLQQGSRHSEWRSKSLQSLNTTIFCNMQVQYKAETTDMYTHIPRILLGILLPLYICLSYIWKVQCQGCGGRGVPFTFSHPTFDHLVK